MKTLEDFLNKIDQWENSKIVPILNLEAIGDKQQFAFKALPKAAKIIRLLITISQENLERKTKIYLNKKISQILNEEE